MRFDKEEWSIKPDTEAKTYLDILQNEVEVAPYRTWSYAVYIIPPTQLFPYMLTVLRLRPEYLRDGPMGFYLTEMVEGVFTFGIDRGKGESDTTDLWCYHKLPKWAYPPSP